MAYQSVKKAAEDLERRAKVVSERTRQKERFSHLPYREMQEWYKKSFDKYRHAGDMWIRARNSKKAIQMYEGAIKFAHSEQVGKKMEERIRGLYGNGKRLEGRVYAIASIISLIGALFFTSLNLSGYATGSLASDTSLMGIVLFILGLITFVFFKSRKK